MQRLKNTFYALAMFLLGIGFSVLIYWEIKFGTAAGSYGSVDKNSVFGGFLWVILFQVRYVFLIFYEMVVAIRNVFIPMNGKIRSAVSRMNTLKFNAAAIIIKATYGIVWGILFTWFIFEIFQQAYLIILPILLDTGKNVFDRLFLPAMMIMGVGVSVYLMITLFFSDLFKNVFPKLPASYRLLTGRSELQ